MGKNQASNRSVKAFFFSSVRISPMLRGHFQSGASSTLLVSGLASHFGDVSQWMDVTGLYTGEKTFWVGSVEKYFCRELCPDTSVLRPVT
jgi:hypothetical protein